MNIKTKFIIYLAVYFFINLLFSVGLGLILELYTWITGNEWTFSAIVYNFTFFMVVGPIGNILISLILKLKYEAYSWYFFTGVVILMILASLFNAIFYQSLSSAV